MNDRLRTLGLVVLAPCFYLVLGPLTATANKGAQGSVQALFQGIPADLRANVKANSVRRDRVNDWLSENVDGKGKAIAVDMSVSVRAKRDANKTYTVQFTEQSPKGRGISVTVLGDEWRVLISVAKAGGKGRSYTNDLVLVGVSTAEAEKLVELKKVHIEGKVKEARVQSGAIDLILEDVLINGKKATTKPKAEGE
jgi:hypothetical protein